MTNANTTHATHGYVIESRRPATSGAKAGKWARCDAFEPFGTAKMARKTIDTVICPCGGTWEYRVVRA